MIGAADEMRPEKGGMHDSIRHRQVPDTFVLGSEPQQQQLFMLCYITIQYHGGPPVRWLFHTDTAPYIQKRVGRRMRRHDGIPCNSSQFPRTTTDRPYIGRMVTRAPVLFGTLSSKRIGIAPCETAHRNAARHVGMVLSLVAAIPIVVCRVRRILVAGALVSSKLLFRLGRFCRCFGDLDGNPAVASHGRRVGGARFNAIQCRIVSPLPRCAQQ